MWVLVLEQTHKCMNNLPLPRAGYNEHNMFSTQTGFPGYGVPRTGFPVRGSPVTGSPDTVFPAYGVPRVRVPPYGVPRTGFPGYVVPRARVPRTGVPRSGVPRLRCSPCTAFPCHIGDFGPHLDDFVAILSPTRPHVGP